jgi:hypothetical protein
MLQKEKAVPHTKKDLYNLIIIFQSTLKIRVRIKWHPLRVGCHTAIGL